MYLLWYRQDLFIAGYWVWLAAIGCGQLGSGCGQLGIGCGCQKYINGYNDYVVQSINYR